MDLVYKPEGQELLPGGFLALVLGIFEQQFPGNLSSVDMVLGAAAGVGECL